WGWLALPNYREPPSPETLREFVRIIRDQFGPGLAALHVSPVSDGALRELLATCRREGIRVALVGLPEAAGMRDLYPPEEWHQVAGSLLRLGREQGVPVIDARAWVGDGGFCDPVHLCHAGAAAYTERLGREVIGPLVEGRLGPPPEAPEGGRAP